MHTEAAENELLQYTGVKEIWSFWGKNLPKLICPGWDRTENQQDGKKMVQAAAGFQWSHLAFFTDPVKDEMTLTCRDNFCFCGPMSILGDSSHPIPCDWGCWREPSDADTVVLDISDLHLGWCVYFWGTNNIFLSMLVQETLPPLLCHGDFYYALLRRENTRCYSFVSHANPDQKSLNHHVWVSDLIST